MYDLQPGGPSFILDNIKIKKTILNNCRNKIALKTLRIKYILKIMGENKLWLALSVRRTNHSAGDRPRAIQTLNVSTCG